MMHLKRVTAIGGPVFITGLVVLTALGLFGCTLTGQQGAMSSNDQQGGKVMDEVMEYNTGLMYYKGEGVPQDYAEAANWFILSAKKGYAPALYSLGHMYSRGNGVPQSMAQAFKHFSLAAEQGYPAAQFAVGYMYAKGQAVPQDKMLSHMWLNLAAASDVSEAAALRDQMAKMMTPEELGKAQRMAVEWTPSPPIGLPDEEVVSKQ